jgi:secondary thiamine-phosphate synthase enzyme
VIASPIGASTGLSCIELATRAPNEFIDITGDVAEVVRRSGVREGLVSVFSEHTTAVVRVQEDEPLLLNDMRRHLEQAAPRRGHYGHNDFRVRTVNIHHDERPNGQRHCLQLLLGASETVPVSGGALLLGEWQPLFSVELDGPGPRRDVVVRVIGVRKRTSRQHWLQRCCSRSVMPRSIASAPLVHRASYAQRASLTSRV